MAVRSAASSQETKFYQRYKGNCLFDILFEKIEKIFGRLL